MYSIDLNPYAPPAELDSVIEPFRNRIERLVSLILSIVGSVLAITITVSSIFLYFGHTSATAWWRLGNDGGLFGILAFAICASLLMALISKPFKANRNAEHIVFSKGLLLIAIFAMGARLLTEPEAAWSPHWPSYLQTFAAASAMGMLFRQMRRRV